MKKISIFALVIVMAFTMVACGRRNDTHSDTPTQDNGTNNSGGDVMPDVIPDVDQNVPDPDVGGAESEPSTNTQDDASQGGQSQDGQSQGNQSQGGQSQGSDTQSPTDDNMGRGMK